MADHYVREGPHRTRRHCIAEGQNVRSVEEIELQELAAFISCTEASIREVTRKCSRNILYRSLTWSPNTLVRRVTHTWLEVLGKIYNKKIWAKATHVRYRLSIIITVHRDSSVTKTKGKI